MLRSFPSIKLLSLVSSNAGTVPRGTDQGVRVGDVVVAQNFAKTNRDGNLAEMDLFQGSDLLATTGINTSQCWSLDEEIATLLAKNNRMRRKSGGPLEMAWISWTR